MECKKCERLLISIYAHIYDKKENPLRKIGKICPVCDEVKDTTEFLNILKKQRQQKKKKPIFSTIITKEQCEKCKSKKINIRKNPERINVKEDKPQNQWNVNKTNPSIEYKCKCGHEWSEYIKMPENPKYLLPPNMTAFQLRLVLQNSTKEVIEDFRITKNLKKMRDKILAELEQERNAKVLRETGKQ